MLKPASKQSLKILLRINGAQPTAGNGEHENLRSNKPSSHIRHGSCQDYDVHKDFEDLLRAASPFFTAQLNEKKRTIDLTELSLQDVDIDQYNDWLHARRLAPNGPNPKIGLEDTMEWQRICEAYLLGEKLQDHNYCNAMADVLVRAASKATKDSIGGLLDCVEHVFLKTEDTSPIQWLLIDIIDSRIIRGASKVEKKIILQARPKFTLARSIRHEEHSITRLRCSDICHYHVHKGKPCHANTETSIWTNMCDVFHDWIGFISTSTQGISDSYQAFRPCVSSTYTVLGKLGAKCKAAFYWCRGVLRDHL